MIIKCEKCQTKFRLDDSRVTDRGVKVRCTKCKHVFTVRLEEPEPEAPLSGAALTTSFIPADEGGEENQCSDGTTAPESFSPPSFQNFALSDTSAEVEQTDSSPFDPSSFSFPSDPSAELEGESSREDAAAPSSAAGEVDFSGFDFGEGEAEPDTTAATTLSADAFAEAAPEPPAMPPVKDAPQGLDFSDDDMFGAVVQPAPEVEKETIVFDFGDESFAESMDVGGDSSARSADPNSLDNAGEAPFNLGEIDFGDELTSVAVQQVNPEDLKPAQEILFAPLAEAVVRPGEKESGVQEEETAVYQQQELPPLSITSRRKQSPLFVVIMAVVALLLVSVLGYFGYSSFANPKESVVAESGKIVTRAVTAAYIDNDEAGELLVVSGEALNEYSKPRAALQISVTVFDEAGTEVATKSAYCGNPLTNEQLESLSIDKIEAAMSNQFGDSLANMEVSPGKAIPFVVVLADLPEGARDFSVQSAGSTVASGKQQ